MYQTIGSPPLNQAAMKQQATTANIYQNAGNTSVPPPRTIASAITRMDAVNDRLSQVHGRLELVASALGALRQVQSVPMADKPPSNGAIDRLNDSANAAHAQLSDIEDLLTAISGALG